MHTRTERDRDRERARDGGRRKHSDIWTNTRKENGRYVGTKCFSVILVRFFFKFWIIIPVRK